jgi:cephalosporin hydroxylase
MAKKNPLEVYFRNNKRRHIRKWVNYLDIYHRHFEPYRGKPIVLVEFGVQFGGSLQMWRHYFGRRAKIYGVDIDPRCLRSKARGTEIFIGDQADRGFLQSIVDKTGPIDIVIEDGGHHPAQQIATFEVLYPHVKDDGLFLIEDLHTSYYKRYDGGLHRPGTFMEYAKRLTDQLTAWHSRERKFVVDDFTRSTLAMHFYNSLIVFEKQPMEKPEMIKTGKIGW